MLRPDGYLNFRSRKNRHFFVRISTQNFERSWELQISLISPSVTNRIFEQKDLYISYAYSSLTEENTTLVWSRFSDITLTKLLMAQIPRFSVSYTPSNICETVDRLIDGWMIRWQSSDILNKHHLLKTKVERDCIT